MKNKIPIRHLLSVPVFFIIFIFLFSSCSKEEDDPQSIVQISTIDALMQGVYDGTTPLSELAKYGNFGIGTFNALDGEMIFLDGKFYQVKSDGKVYQPDRSVLSPFASVTYFNSDAEYNVSDMSYPELKTTIDSLMVSSNLFYAVRLHGTFSRVKTRSVPAQEKPYPPLTEVTANQPEFETQSVTGTLSGFYCPPFVTGLNVSGYHLHFLSDDKSFGGHVLEFELSEGKLMLDQINNFRLILPEEGGFLDTDLTNDLSGDVDDVEGN